MHKKELKTVLKEWGKEIWIVNNKLYCAKLLYIDEGAKSSLHFHPIKQETFYSLGGQISLEIEGKSYMMNPFSRPKTIMPGEKHIFWGLAPNSVLLEISTTHDDKDVVRLTESKSAKVEIKS